MRHRLVLLTALVALLGATVGCLYPEPGGRREPRHNERREKHHEDRHEDRHDDRH